MLPGSAAGELPAFVGAVVSLLLGAQLILAPEAPREDVINVLPP